MKQIFFDRNQLVVIKIFPNSRSLEREIYGTKHFVKIVNVPIIEKLDRKVAKISLMQGFLGYQISEEELNDIVARFLDSTLPETGTMEFSIFEEIKKLEGFFQNDQESLKKLKKIRQQIRSQNLYPIHGDLQKQNIIIADGKLTLIDFEHFMFAPRELEFCNSLFFNDGNCLDIKGILEYLPAGFLDKRILKAMLEFYTIRQISLGMDQIEAQKRLKLGFLKIVQLFTKQKTKLKIERATDYYFKSLFDRMEAI